MGPRGSLNPPRPVGAPIELEALGRGPVAVHPDAVPGAPSFSFLSYETASSLVPIIPVPPVRNKSMLLWPFMLCSAAPAAGALVAAPSVGVVEAAGFPAGSPTL